MAGVTLGVHLLSKASMKTKYDTGMRDLIHAMEQHAHLAQPKVNPLILQGSTDHRHVSSLTHSPNRASKLILISC
jgi:hypothetical protein